MIKKGFCKVFAKAEQVYGSMSLFRRHVEARYGKGPVKNVGNWFLAWRKKVARDLLGSVWALLDLETLKFGDI